MTLAAVFALLVGVSMLVQWTVSYISGGIPELKTEPARIAFHLGAEFTTAMGLIAAGMGLIFGWSWARDLFLVASGLLIYTAIVSPGYFVHKGQPIWLLVFGMILTLDLWALAGLWR